MSFQRFDIENDVVENQKTTISSGLRIGFRELTAYYTQSNFGQQNEFLLGCLQ